MKTHSSLRWCVFRCLLLSTLFLLSLTLRSTLAGSGSGSALHFNGVDSFVSIPHTNGLNPFPLAITAWIRTSDTTGGGALVFKQPLVGAYWNVSVFSGTLYAEIFRTFADLSVTGTSSLADGQWHHIAFTADTNGGTLYVDGVLNGSGVWSGSPGTGNADGELDLGSTTFKGEMDEVTMWNVALTQSEILTYKNRRLTGNEAGLVAYYRCDEGGGTNLFDSAPTSGSNDGTLHGGMSFTSSAILPFGPSVATLPATAVGAGAVILNGVANPSGTNTSTWFEWGTNTDYGPVTAVQSAVGGTADTDFSQVVLGLTPITTHQYRAVASNSLGMVVGTNQTFLTTVPGDLSGDGIVDEGELQTVLSKYFPYSPRLRMTNVAGLGGTNVTFALSNSTAGAFSVEYTTSLSDWQLLGPATPRYLFTDTNAPAVPQRCYRLRWP